MSFTDLPDLALRGNGGSVVWANDEFFAERENLIRPGAATFHPGTFGHKGQVYDGWETRRRREAGVDEAIVRLGVPGEIHGVVVDTAWFKGNYPPEVSVEAAVVRKPVPGHAVRDSVGWVTIVPRSPVAGDSANPFPVIDRRRFTHVKLTMYPDGGVARLRVHGIGRPNPAVLAAGPVDLAALENGGLVTGCSNLFYSSPLNLISPGLAQVMGDGWETARRRDDGNDWVEFQLAAEGTVRMVELDTTWFVGNSPGAARVRGRADGGEWFDVLPRTTLLPDTRHRFPVEESEPVSEARLDIYPDGGMGRMRLWGNFTPDGWEAIEDGAAR